MIIHKVKRLLYKFIQRKRAKKLLECGKNVRINRGCSFIGNIRVGSNVSIGEGNYFVSTGATLYIHDYVLFGPNVTIYTGDHKTDEIGKHIIEIKDNDKALDIRRWDRDVVIKAGAWIGTRVIILKGVTIGQGAVIGAGSIVSKDVPPYHVYVGTPQSHMLKPRFTDEQISKHERILKERGIPIE